MNYSDGQKINKYIDRNKMEKKVEQAREKEEDEKIKSICWNNT